MLRLRRLEQRRAAQTFDVRPLRARPRMRMLTGPLSETTLAASFRPMPNLSNMARAGAAARAEPATMWCVRHLLFGALDQRFRLHVSRLVMTALLLVRRRRSPLHQSPAQLPIMPMKASGPIGSLRHMAGLRSALFLGFQEEPAARQWRLSAKCGARRCPHGRVLRGDQ